VVGEINHEPMHVIQVSDVADEPVRRASCCAQGAMISVINWRQSTCVANFFYKSPEDGVLFSFILEIAEFALGKTRVDCLMTKNRFIQPFRHNTGCDKTADTSAWNIVITSRGRNRARGRRFLTEATRGPGKLGLWMMRIVSGSWPRWTG